MRTYSIKRLLAFLRWLDANPNGLIGVGNH
jgi:hypothetical protein